MIKVKLSFPCKLCNFTDFYIMPVGEKTQSGDVVRSLKEWQLLCKKCKKSYILDIKITAI